MADAPRVFLSYSHDSAEHADRVLALADALCDGGIDVILDRYVHPAPAEGWPHWMDRNLDEAKFVLMVCTATYRRRVMGREEPGKGLGVRWQGSLISNRIYHDKPSGSRFIPILLSGSELAHIPNPVQGHAYYRLATFDLTDPGYEALYRHLTNQPATPRPDLGALVILPPKPRPALLGPKQSVGVSDVPNQTVILNLVSSHSEFWWYMGLMRDRSAMQIAGDLSVMNISECDVCLMGAKLRKPKKACRVYPFGPKEYRVVIPVGRVGDFRFDCFVQPSVCEKGRPFKTDVTIIYQFGNERWLRDHILKRIEFQYNDGQLLPYNY